MKRRPSGSMPLSKAVVGFVNHKLAEGLTVRSVNSYERILNKWIEHEGDQEITDIEPLRFNLFFERFINPERMSYPDIDVDICMERRSEVIDYTINKYGKDRVAQIITFGKMKAKMAIKDVGRVMSVPLSKVNNIAKLVPEDANMTLDRALSIDHDLRAMYESDDEAKMVIDIAKKIEGSIRNTSIHAAGIIVSANPIMENVPVCVAKDADMVVTQFAMKPSEAVGMLKIDFLGLKTLTGIQKAVKSVKSNFNIDVPWEKLDLEDKKTFNLLNKGKTLGVFQLESSGMQDLAKQLHIDLFEEIIAVAALYRPGPMDMIPSFVNRKHKREKIENDHPLMEDVLSETYGVMVYQEQVMLIASLLAGYSLGEGDVLRRAMGKKDFVEMTAQRDKFIEGAFKKDINRELAGMIFDKIEKFASYGFNKSHAAAYAYLSYVTAFLKANYPNEWMAALMTCDRDDLTKVAKFIHECQSMKIEILPPDINIASDEFVPTGEGIRFAMSGIKGVGTGVVEEIIKEREKQGKFKSLYDFIKRINMLRVGKKMIALLIDAGAFDFTTWSRDELRESIEEIYTEVQKNQKEKEKGILNFVTMMENDDEKFSTPPKVLEKSTENEMLRKEKELLGFYLTSHPMNNYKKIINKIRCVSLKELEEKDHDCFCRLAFIVDDIKTKIAAKSQKKFAILTISDGLEKFELPIWPEHFEKHQEILEENKLYFAVVQVDKKEGSMRLHLHFLEELEKVNETVIHTSEKAIEIAKKQLMHIRNRKKYIASSNNSQTVLKIMLKIDVEKAKLSDILSLKYLFRQNAGKTPVDIFFYSKDKKLAKLFIDTKWGINYSENFSSKLKENQAVVAVKIKK